jgi:hypothetical protein
VPDHLLIC